jgi:hypothetical protein
MLDTVMLMSELEIRDIRTARKARAIRNDRAERMTLARAGMVCLAAVLMTAVWAPIIYFGSMLFGAAIELAVLGRIIAAIFFVSLIVMSLAVSTSENSPPDDIDRRGDR